MIERLQQLAPREQLVLGVGTLLAVLIIGWTFVWAPLQSGSARRSEAIEAQARLLVDLRRAANLRGSTEANPTSGANTQSLVVLVDQTARPHGLAGSFSRTRPEGQDSIHVTFRDASFDALIAWLIELERQYGVAVLTVNSISAAGPPGLVNGQILLGR